MDSIDDAELFHSALFKSLHKRLVVTPEISRVKKLLGRTKFSMHDVGCVTVWISQIWVDATYRFGRITKGITQKVVPVHRHP